MPTRSPGAGFERRGEALIDAGVPFAVMLMDLDRFKAVNGSLGIAGPGLPAATLAERLREADMAMYRCKKAGQGNMAFADDTAGRADASRRPGGQPVAVTAGAG